MKTVLAPLITSLAIGIALLTMVLVMEWGAMRTGDINIISMIAILGAGGIMVYGVLKLRALMRS